MVDELKRLLAQAGWVVFAVVMPVVALVVVASMAYVVALGLAFVPWGEVATWALVSVFILGAVGSLFR